MGAFPLAEVTEEAASIAIYYTGSGVSSVYIFRWVGRVGGWDGLCGWDGVYVWVGIWVRALQGGLMTSCTATPTYNHPHAHTITHTHTKSPTPTHNHPHTISHTSTHIHTQLLWQNWTHPCVLKTAMCTGHGIAHKLHSYAGSSPMHCLPCCSLLLRGW